MFREVTLSNGQKTLIDEKYYLEVVNAGPWHFQGGTGTIPLPR